MPRFPRRLVFLLSFLALAATPARALDHVRVQLKWLHQFQFAGYYAAVEKGYYRDAGLEVDLLEGKPDLDPAKVVLAGSADFGVGTPEILLLRAKGEPLVVLGVIFQHSPYIFLTLHASGISDVVELAGKRVMMEPQAAELYAYLNREHVPASSLKILPHAFSSADLLEGRADAMSSYSTDEPFALRDANIPFLTFSPRAGGVDFYGDCFFTTEKQIHDHPARVRAFYDATLKGWDYAMRHPDEIIALLVTKYHSAKSPAALAFEAAQMRDLMHPDIIPIGYMYPGRWQHIAEAYEELGMLPPGYSLKGFLYDRNPKADLTPLYWTLALLATVAAIAVAWLLPLRSLNRRLRAEVAERRRAEETANRTSEAKSRYIALLGHEVRTPLSGINSSIDLLKHAGNGFERAELLDILEKSADGLLAMVDNILDHSKLEAGQMRAQPGPIVLERLTADLRDLFAGSAGSKGIHLESRIQEGLPAVISSDPIRLRQILSNLISNAIKFTPHGSVRLDLRPDGERILFSVRDTGPGIPPEKLTTIFEAYDQGGTSIAGGTGLGLTISRQLAELLGGAITLESRPGEGATFTLALPLVSAEE